MMSHVLNVRRYVSKITILGKIMKKYYGTYEELLENMKGGTMGGHDRTGWYKLIFIERNWHGNGTEKYL